MYTVIYSRTLQCTLQQWQLKPDTPHYEAAIIVLERKDSTASAPTRPCNLMAEILFNCTQR